MTIALIKQNRMRQNYRLAAQINILKWNFMIITMVIKTKYQFMNTQWVVLTLRRRWAGGL